MGYPGGEYMTPEQIEAQQRAIEENKKESHDDGLKGHEKEMADYRRLNSEFPLKTDFNAHDLSTLKGMIEAANPDGVESIGNNWKRVHTLLVGDGGAPSGDSAYGQLKKAVEGVLEHWEGESANQFRTKANKILRQIANGASHAQTVSQVMGQAANDLRTQRDAMSKIEPPNWLDSAWDFVTDSGRDDKYTKQDVQNGNVPKDLIASANEGYLSEGKEQQLKAVAVMETLGRSYVGYGKRLTSPVGDSDNTIPPSNPDTPMPTPIPTFPSTAEKPSRSRRPATTTGLTSTSKVPEAVGPRDPAISGGKQIPTVGANVDSLPTGISGSGSDGLPSGGTVRGGVGPGGPVAGPVGGGPVGGVPNGGVLGGAAGARSGVGRPGISGTGAAGGRSARAGIGGAGGMGARGGGGMAGARGAGAGAGGRGPLARAKGGVVGAPKGISGGKPATPGGTGLGKGRSGPAGRTGGMLGGARGRDQRPREEENEQGSRPDYLVEDEETWTPEDNRSVPRTIE